MRICVLAPEFIPVWGGAGTYTRELVKHLPKAYDIHVVTPKRESFGTGEGQGFDHDLREEISSNVHIHYVSSASDTFFYNAKFQYACFRYVPEILKQEHIDIIHSHMSHMPDLLLRLRALRAPTIVTLHNTIKIQRSAIRLSTQPFSSLERSEKAVYLLYPALSFAEEVYLRGSKRCIAPSQWMREELLRLAHLSKEWAKKVMVIPNSIDVNECRKVASYGRKCLPESFGNRRIVLYCGRLMANKGTDLLVESIPGILGEIGDELLFVFAGPGESSRYAARLKQLGVSAHNFLFTGPISRARCLEMMGCAELLVLPSFLENCPYAVLEAMACGVPVVASNVGGIPEIIESGQNGMTFPQGSSAELSEKVVMLLQDKGLQRRLSRKALQTVFDRFSWSSNLNKQIQAYEMTLD
jgi:glycosyltransferase involved in cell wall biosynthesis